MVAELDEFYASLKLQCFLYVHIPARNNRSTALVSYQLAHTLWVQKHSKSGSGAPYS